MAQRDTLDKIIGTYFAMVTTATFVYKGKTYEPKELRVSPMIFRGFTCPAKCGGCCPRFSLDYLPDEYRPTENGQLLNVNFQSRDVMFNGRRIEIVSDMQKDHEDYHCKNLDADGRCGVHGKQPFSCDFELIRFLEFKEKHNHLTQKLFGRGWAMLRVDGERGALCEMTPVDEHTKNEVVRKLKRLKQWCEHFGLTTKLDTIIAWAENGPHDKPLIV